VRIISGEKKGILLHAPANLPVRPTTDRAKESLFNILENNFHLENLSVLDLFAGTGNISYEFASRGALAILSIDQDAGCVKYMKSVVQKLDFANMEVRKQDVFAYLKQADESFDIIFGDAPYALAKIPEIPGLVFEKGLLKPGGWLILEHATMMQLNHLPHFFDERKYGQSTFSFFKSEAQ
jgi:16S rRNA (guanine966-N2)-methyltransferase